MRRMVEREQECCALLRFDLRCVADAVELCIIASEAARDAVGPIYAEFLDSDNR